MKLGKTPFAIALFSMCLAGNTLAQDSTTESDISNEPTEPTSSLPIEEQYVEQDTSGFVGSIGITYLALSKELTRTEQIGENAVSLDLIGSYNFASRFLVSAGMGLVTFDDKAQFSQEVVVSGLFGSENETVESEAEAILLRIEAQYLAPPLSSLGIQFRVGAGYGAITAAERSIDKCTDCREESIDVEGGAYMTGGLFILAFDRVNIGFSANKYFSSDIKATATLLLEYPF